MIGPKMIQVRLKFDQGCILPDLHAELHSLLPDYVEVMEGATQQHSPFGGEPITESKALRISIHPQGKAVCNQPHA